MRRPLFSLLLVYVGGMGAGAFIDPPLASVFFALAILVGFQIWLLRRAPASGEPRISSGMLPFAAFALIGLIGQERIEREDRDADRIAEGLERAGWLRIEGRLAAEPETRADRLVVTLDQLRVEDHIASGALPGRLRLSLIDEARDAFAANPPLPGSRVRVDGVIYAPRPARNPGLMDYRGFLRAREYLASMTCDTSRRVEVFDPSDGFTARERMLRVAAGVRRASAELLEAYVGREQAPLLRSMLFGEASLLSDEEREWYARAGLVHLFSVSGLHATLLATLVFFLLRAMGAPYRLSWLLAAAFVWGFAALVGFKAPVVRTAIMATTLAASVALMRPGDMLNTLSLAGLITLIPDPRALYRPDFQFSYLCVFTIIVLGPALESVFCRAPEGLAPRGRLWAVRWNRWIGTPLVLACAGQLALIPFLAHSYHYVSLAAPLSNVAVLGFGCIAVGLGFLLLVIGWMIEPAALALGALCRWDMQIFEALAAGVGRMEWAAVSMPSPPWWAALSYYGILFGGYYVMPALAPGQREKARARLAVHVAALVALLVWLPALGGAREALMVRALDVGQGDAFYVEFPSGHNILIDGGRGQPRDMGEAVVVPFLNARGVKSLSAVIATHADADHIGGLASVLRAMPVGVVIHGPDEADTETYRDFHHAAREAGARLEPARRGARIRGIPGADLLILHPGFANAAGLEDNDLSVVARLDYGEFSMLFAGDAGHAAERRMLAAGAPLDCDFLAVGHHGSAGSSGLEFLGAITPDGAIISCGANNRYGHPAPETLDRLRQSGARVFRTDLSGSVAIFSDGWDAWVEIAPTNHTNFHE